MLFKATFTNGTETVELPAGRSSLWNAYDATQDCPENQAKSGRLTFAWGYFAAKKAGRLADLGIDEGMEQSEAIELIADSWDLLIDEPDRKQAPLADTPSRSQ